MVHVEAIAVTCMLPAYSFRLTFFRWAIEFTRNGGPNWHGLLLGQVGHKKILKVATNQELETRNKELETRNKELTEQLEEQTDKCDHYSTEFHSYMRSYEICCADL